MCWTVILPIRLAPGASMQQGTQAVQESQICQMLLEQYLDISSQSPSSTQAVLQLPDEPVHESANAADGKVLQATFLHLLSDTWLSSCLSAGSMTALRGQPSCLSDIVWQAARCIVMPDTAPSANL